MARLSGLGTLGTLGTRAALAAALLGGGGSGAAGVTGCSAAAPAHGAQAASSQAGPVPAPVPVAPAPPPKDDGSPSQGGSGGLAHAAALEELRVARPGWRSDRQGSLRIQLPDAAHWLRGKFWGVKSLVGFRYGREHHAIVAAFIVHVDDENAPGACGKAFEEWAQPYVDSFDVAIEHDPPRAVPWNGKIVDIDSVVARTATLGDRDEYAAVYATYPAWKKACLVMGIAVPARDELERAKAVRDRFTTEILPQLRVLATEEPKELY
jgi:hypothetical protein